MTKALPDHVIGGCLRGCQQLELARGHFAPNRVGLDPRPRDPRPEAWDGIDLRDQIGAVQPSPRTNGHKGRPDPILIQLSRAFLRLLQSTTARDPWSDVKKECR
jgi:hypothetical protein